tara:strand:+ start:252 stop:458 length:207 start_codon:yes stop_codon:yes gene_type:complete
MIKYMTTILAFFVTLSSPVATQDFNMERAALAYVLALKLYLKVQQSPPDMMVFSLTKVASGLKPSINA